MDIAALRAEAERIVKASPLYDGKRFNLIVIDSEENTLKIRVSISAKDSADVWDLKSEVREKLVTYLQQAQPHALPRTRVDLSGREPQPYDFYQKNTRDRTAPHG